MEPHTETGINYLHSHAPSLKSQLLQFLMTILRKKTTIEKNIKVNQFASKAEEIPQSLLSNFHIQQEIINQRNVWTIKPKVHNSQNIILYFHGGGYISNLTKFDWRFIQELSLETNCAIVVPDYPLSPVSTYKDVYQYFNILYLKLLSQTSPENIIFMGNSAGGGIALGFAQKLREEKKPQPSQIILNSPWLDISLTNQDIVQIDKKDKLLDIKGLKMAGRLYAEDLESTDHRVSPLYGKLSDLGRISFFIGTHDIFLADVRKLRDKLQAQNISCNYFEYPRMFHVWFLLTSLREAKHALGKMAMLINQREV